MHNLTFHAMKSVISVCGQFSISLSGPRCPKMDIDLLKISTKTRAWVLGVGAEYICRMVMANGDLFLIIRIIYICRLVIDSGSSEVCFLQCFYYFV